MPDACDLVITDLQDRDAHDPAIERDEHRRAAVDHAGVDRNLIADVFGIARGSVWDISTGRSWSHLAA